MKFNVRTILTAPAVLLMLSSVGAGAVNADQVNNTSNNSEVTYAFSPNGQLEAYRHAGNKHDHDIHHGHMPSILTQTANAIGGQGKQTTGGTKAARQAVVVSSVDQLRSVLKKAHNKPAVVIIKGTLDGNYDQRTKKDLTASDYAKNTGYNFNQYLKDYNPKTYGKKEPAGQQENARIKAQKNQEKQITVNIPSNVSVIGAPGSQIKNLELKINGQNDIVRNLNIQTPTDDFPGWDPQDGKSGNWNSQYDAISIRGGQDVWLDHNTISDGSNPDQQASDHTFGRQYQQHDGATDITNGADHITVSNSKYLNHDKTMLIGNSDSRVSDQGKLNVTLYHNYFGNTTQRDPRVRFGNVNMEDNYYENDGNAPYNFGYVWGYGKDATITGNHNTLSTSNKNAVKKFVSGTAGKSIAGRNTEINGTNYTIMGNGSNVSVQKTDQESNNPGKDDYNSTGATLNFNSKAIKKHNSHKKSKQADHKKHAQRKGRQSESAKRARIARIRARNNRIRRRRARKAHKHNGNRTVTKSIIEKPAKVQYHQHLKIGDMVLNQDPITKGTPEQTITKVGSSDNSNQSSDHSTNNGSTSFSKQESAAFPDASSSSNQSN